MEGRAGEREREKTLINMQTMYEVCITTVRTLFYLWALWLD